MKTWAAIMAGGDGSRLSAVTRAIEGDGRPKQFCRLISGRTLLGDTRARLAPVIDPACSLIVVSAPHRPYYGSQLGAVPPSLLIEQPANRGTVAAIAYAVGRVRRLDPDAILAVVPSDHYYANNMMVQQAISMACQDAALNPDHLILLGAEPDSADPDYGWIIPGGPAKYPFTDNRLFAVSRFFEKPSPRMAEHLLSIGGMWSTFVVVGTLQAFDDALLRHAQPWHTFAEAITNAGDNDRERLIAERSYQNLDSACFSASVLGPSPDHCLVVRMRHAGWTDVGTPHRLAAVQPSQSA